MKIYLFSTQRGFTLVEVLVALVIIAVALSALITVGMWNAKHASYLKQKSFAHWVAMNKVAELRLDDKWPSIGKKKDTQLMAQQEWRWEVEIKVAPGDKDLRIAEVSVYPVGQDEGEPLVTLLTFLGKV